MSSIGLRSTAGWPRIIGRIAWKRVKEAVKDGLEVVAIVDELHAQYGKPRSKGLFTDEDRSAVPTLPQNGLQSASMTIYSAGVAVHGVTACGKKLHIVREVCLHTVFLCGGYPEGALFTSGVQEDGTCRTCLRLWKEGVR